jgi:hypothetical protein
MKSIKGALILGSLAFASKVFASPFTPGDLLVSNAPADGPQTVSEYTPAGSLIQTISVPRLPGQDSTFDTIKGLTVDQNGNLDVYNGEITAGISIYNSKTGKWASASIPGLSGGSTSGKIVSSGNYAFLTDVGDADGSAGIVRYNLQDGSWARFGSGDITQPNDGPIDLAISPSGLLYSLNGEGSPSGREIQIYDPNTLQLVRTIDLTDISRTLAPYAMVQIQVNGDGSIWGNELYSPTALLDSNGDLLKTYTYSQGWFSTDFRVGPNGAIAQVDGFDHLYLYDSQMNPIGDFQTGGYFAPGAFLAWVPQAVPEPSPLSLLLPLALLAKRRRN